MYNYVVYNFPVNSAIGDLLCFCVANGESLVVDYNVLANEQQVIAFFLPEAPTEMLKIFDEVQLGGCWLHTEIRHNYVFD